MSKQPVVTVCRCVEYEQPAGCPFRNDWHRGVHTTESFCVHPERGGEHPLDVESETIPLDCPLRSGGILVTLAAQEKAWAKTNSA